MTPQFAVGDRVVIQGFAPDIDGREGTVIVAEFSAARPYPYRVRIDNDSDWGDLYGRLFTANELIAVSKPVPEPGTLIRVKQGSRGDLLSADYIGKTFTVVPKPDRGERAQYDIFVLEDEVDAEWPLPLYDDEYEIVEPTPTPQFAPGDRVVYTIPEVYYGRPGKNSAARPAGSEGTVTEVYDSGAVNVNWDDYGLVNVDTAFLAHAPKPTHKYPEGLYRGDTGARLFVQHAADGRYAVTYLEEIPNDPRLRHTNPSLGELPVSYYTLIAETPKA